MNQGFAAAASTPPRQRDGQRHHQQFHGNDSKNMKSGNHIEVASGYFSFASPSDHGHLRQRGECTVRREHRGLATFRAVKRRVPFGGFDDERVATPSYVGGSGHGSAKLVDGQGSYTRLRARTAHSEAESVYEKTLRILMTAQRTPKNGATESSKHGHMVMASDDDHPMYYDQEKEEEGGGGGGGGGGQEGDTFSNYSQSNTLLRYFHKVQ